MPALAHTLVGHLTRRAAFGRDFRMSAFRGLSLVSSQYQKNPELMGARQEPHQLSEATVRERPMLAA